MGQAPRELDPRTSAAAAFGAELRDRRVQSNRSLRELGQLVLVSGDLLGKIEKGQRRPHSDLVERLDAVLETRGELKRLAALFVDFRVTKSLVAVPLSPDAAVEQIRNLIMEVRAADHGMTADRLREVVGHAEAAEAVVSKVAPAQRKPLLRIVAEAYQLAGWMLFDQGHVAGAERTFSRAKSAAERAGALDLVAYIGGPNAGFMSTWGGDPTLGAERAYGSLAWAKRSSNRRLTAFVATIAARAHARMGEAELCVQMLADAETELERHRAEEPDPNWLAVFDEAALAGHRGSCWLDLGNPRQAAELLREQESTSPIMFVRNKIIWQLEYAEAKFRLGDIEAAVVSLEQTLDYAEPGPITPRVIRMFRSIDMKMRAEARDVAVTATRERLHEFIAGRA
ncbi:helix-turn-helix domain-containing protein [Nocardia uniformis]|uniref:Helix-turn-helix domain-containing protein n=2 Tax=Nocardia uniformis TaxID=53432 RepID=A0A849C7P4_9NOCA|nr:helix-turn-helix domain-containing protein [Nocardia uniformis]